MNIINDPAQKTLLKFAAHVILDYSYATVNLIAGFILGQAYSSGEDVNTGIFIIIVVNMAVALYARGEK